ncbi:hypothetical protein IDJ77_03935 [Mucilaginibacter sp. ZT4R22]|uniref:DUF3945 domain-containing protein n=1 Tax=Mucilaginibacter pankratovii TaxID=2772110 RepID=A0ABR7WKU5_9SPHI|nr:hypothetical protein [Mucilaginibacter pankratovii]MBD1362951.1 hypothetical protein [Mucilaginibacter pankratovii]
MIMDDELPIDPRETDYLDHYDMSSATNFFELKTQLADLGFNDPTLVDALRESIFTAEYAVISAGYKETINDFRFTGWFEFHRNMESGAYELEQYQAMLYDFDGRAADMMLDKDINKTEALEVLRTEFSRNEPDLTLYWPMTRQTMQTYFLNINQNQMNTENLNYLQKQLLNLGFGEKSNDELEKNIKSGKKEFTIPTSQEYNKQNVDYTLHYKAGDNNEMYFFNKYDASLRDKEMQQTFYINKGGAITAKEAYNLMEGRAVHKQLENSEGEKYNAWIVIDKENKTDNGNFKLRPFTEGWNYKPERAIDKMDIVGINDEGAREKLMKSLEKGNRHQVTALKDGKEVKLYIEANPAEHRVNLTNYKGEAQQLEHYKKPEFKNENKKDQKQAQSTEDAPEKKQRKGAKMKV